MFDEHFIFWDMTSCKMVHRYNRVGGAGRFRVSQSPGRGPWTVIIRRWGWTFDYVVVIIIIVNSVMIAASVATVIIVAAAATFPCQRGDVANVSVPDSGAH